MQAKRFRRRTEDRQETRYTRPLGAMGKTVRSADDREKRLRRQWTLSWFVLALSLPGLVIGVREIIRSVLPTAVSTLGGWKSMPTFHEPAMVLVPPGEFLMGSPAEEPDRRDHEGPQRKVVIAQPFELGKFEVTFAEWDVCLAEGACKNNPSANGWGRGRRPVIFVSWQDAQQYLTWLSRKMNKQYRLPTEAEWEYAARAGSAAPYAFGDTITKAQAQYATDRTAEVGSFKPNAFGLYDMHGNVWEWVEDCYIGTYAGMPRDGSAPATACADGDRVVRGGSWYNSAKSLRSASRDSDTPDMRYDILGFRLARTIKP
jgi:formylglycine-generating enzyme required for sulfatase activity